MMLLLSTLSIVSRKSFSFSSLSRQQQHIRTLLAIPQSPKHQYNAVRDRIQQQLLYASSSSTTKITSSTFDNAKDNNSNNNNEIDATTTTTVSSTNDYKNDDIDDPLRLYRNENNVRDQVFSAISGAGGIKVTAVTARNLLNDLMIQHTMTSTSADALGRTIICSILMANGIQDEQIVQITINTEGPIRGIVAICSGQGEVRGYVGSPMLGNDLSLIDAVGTKGAVHIVKNHPDWPRPYNGITAVRHGDIDRDIGIYLAESEQRSCALAAATSVIGILCNAAGGYLIEQLPGTTDEERQVVQQNLAKLVALDGGDTLPTNLLLSGRTPLDIVQIVLDGLDMVPLQQIEPVLKCECTEDRLIRSLRLLPSTDVDEILLKQERVEARCEFCGKVYRLEAHEVREKLDVSTPSNPTDLH